MGLFDEIGQSAQVNQRSGGRGEVDDEPLPVLKGRRSVRVYREINDNNSAAGAAMQITEFILQRVPWKAQPKGPSASQKSEAEWLTTVWGDTDPGMTWSFFISDAISTWPYGWSLFEWALKQRNGTSAQPHKSSKYNDGRLGLRGLFIRPQETKEDWVFGKHGEVVAFIQKLPTGSVTIPIAKCLHLRTKSNRGNPEGRSIYRNAYRSWVFLKRFEEIEGVGFSKALQGVPIGYMPQEYFDTSVLAKDATKKSTKDNIKKTFAGLHRNEYEYLLYPAPENEKGKTGWGVDQFKVPDGRFKEIRDAINGKMREILSLLFGSQFLLFGQGENSGSRALSSDQTDLHELMLQSILSIIEDAIDEQITQKLYALNGVPPEDRARWTAGKISQEDAKKWADTLKTLMDSGAVTRDDDLEDHAREKNQYPPRKIDEDDESEPDVSAEDLDPEDEEEDAEDELARQDNVKKRKGVPVFVPSEAMASTAQKLLEAYGKLPEQSRKLSQVALASARGIAKRAPMSMIGVQRLAAFFEHHQAPSKKSSEWRKHGRSWQHWNAWGGDAAKRWVADQSKEPVAQGA